MDYFTNWCLVCEKQTSRTAYYCSSKCRAKDILLPSTDIMEGDEEWSDCRSISSVESDSDSEMDAVTVLMEHFKVKNVHPRITLPSVHSLYRTGSPEEGSFGKPQLWLPQSEHKSASYPHGIPRPIVTVKELRSTASHTFDDIVPPLMSRSKAKYVGRPLAPSPNIGIQ